MADLGRNDNPFVDDSTDSPFVTGSEYSFKSILADVKGSDYIDSGTAMPPALIEAEAERILREAAQISMPVGGASQNPDARAQQAKAEQTKRPAEPVPAAEPAPPPAATPARQAAKTTTADLLISEAYERLDKPDAYNAGAYAEPEFTSTNDIPMIVTPFEEGSTSAAPGVSAKEADESGAIFNGESFDPIAKKARPMFADDLPSIDIPVEDDEFENVAKASRERREMFNQAIVSEDEEFGREPDEDELFEEPRLKDQAIKFARTCNSIAIRLVPATIITLIMVLITFVFEAGMIVPYGIGTSLMHAAGTLVVLLLIVMMLCIEVIVRGVDCLIQGKPNAETLILFSCVFSLLSATFTILSGAPLLLPFCAVSALSLLFAGYGERSNLRAMTDALKTAISSAEPYGVQAEYNENLDNTVLKKAYGRTDGFYTNMVQLDICEMLYRFAAPVLMIAALFVTCLYVLVNARDGGVEYSLHILSAMLASAAPFSAILAYALPFSIVTRAASKMGAAIAGWGGADDIAHTDGACVTDDDMFPTGTLKLSGIKIFDGAPQNNVLCYTGSLIIASGSGLAGLFSEALQEKNIVPMRVADFEYHESGISAIVQGHKVATGSAAHMNLIGVRVPDDSNLRNAVFTAVNGRLVAMFTIEYHPLPIVQKALISMIKWRIDLFFAMRDFNITPSMVGQKFKVPFESFVFMPVQEAYAVSDPYSGKEGRMASVLVCESLSPYAEAITGARLLRTSSFFASVLSVITAAFGMLLMFIMIWGESFESAATPGNLILYGFCMLAAVLFICAYTKMRR